MIESFDLSKVSDMSLYNDLLIYAITNKISLEDTYRLLCNNFTVTSNINIDIMKRIAEYKETLLMIENDKAISLWARLLPTYKDHLNNANSTKENSTTLSLEVLLKILYPNATLNSKGIVRSALSRTKAYINKCLPKGTILISMTSREEVQFTFVTSDDKNEAHKLLVQLGNTSLQTIDKLLAQMGFIE